MSSRLEKLLVRIDPARQSGLEIGALCRPIVAPGTGDIRFVDHCSTAELKAKYAGFSDVDTDAIVDVNYIWGNQPLSKVVGEGCIDYILASHVVEHVPNMIAWLLELADVLKAGGVLSLAIPDKRFCFDCCRENTNISCLLEAFFEERRRPNLRQIADFHLNVIHTPTAEDLWSSRLAQRDLQPVYSVDDIDGPLVSDIKRRLQEGEYLDVHCNVFTPYSFFEILSKLATMGLLNYKVTSFIDTAQNEGEFYVSLERLPRDLELQDRKKLSLQSIPVVTPPLLPGQLNSLNSESQRNSQFLSTVFQHHATVEGDAATANAVEIEKISMQLKSTELQLNSIVAANLALQREIKGLRHSTSWRVTAPMRRVREMLRK